MRWSKAVIGKSSSAAHSKRNCLGRAEIVRIFSRGQVLILGWRCESCLNMQLCLFVTERAFTYPEVRSEPLAGPEIIPAVSKDEAETPAAHPTV